MLRAKHFQTVLCLLLIKVSLIVNNPATAQQPLPAIEWEPCSLVPGANDGLAECASVEMPLFHDDPEGPTISIAVKRLRAQNTSRGQFWFIDGGPGDSGIANFAAPAAFAQVFDDLDIYTLDHRGVGGSERLSCPDQEAENSELGREISENEWNDCIAHLLQQYGDNLNAFTTTESARDLGQLIEATRQPGQKVWVWGVSYGTFLVNRYLQLFSDQADGIIMDSLQPADWSFSEFDAGLDQIGRLLLTRCGEDPRCSSFLGSDPEATAEALLEKLKNGHCSELGVTPELLRILLGSMLVIGSPWREYIPAVIHRLNRCAEADQLAIIHLFDALSGEDGLASEPASHSQVLQFHVAISELWREDAPSAEELEAALDSTIMTTAVSVSFARLIDKWPTYDPASYDDTFANYDGPMLMLQSGLDFAMPVERLQEMRQVFSGPNQTFAFFPNAQHGVINNNDCAGSLYVSFLFDPEAPLDLSCIDQAPPLNFDGDPEITKFLFGTTDIWGTDVVSVPEVDDLTPQEFTLHDSYPNPFSLSKTNHASKEITNSYNLKGALNSFQAVQLKIYDILGREIRILLDEKQAPGSYSITWDGRDNKGLRVAAGVYFVRLTVGKATQSKLLTVIR